MVEASIMDLVLSRANPKGDAEIYIRSFRRVRTGRSGGLC